MQLIVRMLRHGSFARAAGLVINRQRPATASGVLFITLEDESGYINLVCWPRVVDAQRGAILGARLMGVSGKSNASPKLCIWWRIESRISAQCLGIY